MAAVPAKEIPIWKYLDSFILEKDLIAHVRLQCTSKPQKSSEPRNYIPEYLKADGVTWMRLKTLSPPVLGEGLKLNDIGLTWKSNSIATANYLANISANFNATEIEKLGGQSAVDEAKKYLAFYVRLKGVLADLLYIEMQPGSMYPSDTWAALADRCDNDPVKMKTRFLEEFKWWPEMKDKEVKGRVYEGDKFKGEKMHNLKCDVFYRSNWTPKTPEGIPNNDPTNPPDPQQIEEIIVKMESLGYKYNKIQFVDVNGPVQLYDIKVIEYDGHGMPIKKIKVPKREPHPVLHGEYRLVINGPHFTVLKYRPVISLTIWPKLYDQASSKDLSYGVSLRFSPEIAIILQGTDFAHETVDVASISPYAVAGNYDNHSQPQQEEYEYEEGEGEGGGGKLANMDNETDFPHALEADDNNDIK